MEQMIWLFLIKKKIIQLFGGWSNHLTITIFQFDDDNSLSIKIYNTNIDKEFSNIQRPKLIKIENSFIVCLSAVKGDIQRPGFFMMNFPNVKNETLSEDKLKKLFFSLFWSFFLLTNSKW